ncbi:MAG: HAD-IA family hydrolase [Candidatus Dojkabacteria bacterium]|nr:HAD-IA family hydrolase [Candidatus Dojkabacteria bacterium]
MKNTIIFDFGGVLGSDADTIFFEILSKYGIPNDLATDIWRQHWPKMKTGKEHVDAIWETVGKYIKSNLKTITDEYAQLIIIDPKAIELCEKLKKKGYKLGVLANEAFEWMDIKREKGNLDAVFDITYASADLKVPKPEAPAYLKTLESLNAKPEETIFIDNMERNTVAAEKLGIKSLLYKGLRQLGKDLINIGVL